MSLFRSFGSSASISFEVKGPSKGRTIEIPTGKEGETNKVPVFQSEDPVSGEVLIKIPAGKKLEHSGIKLDLIGQIDSAIDRSTLQFLTLTTELEKPGELNFDKGIPFEFRNVDKPFDSYHGINVTLRYILRCTVKKALMNMTADYEIWVQNYTNEPEINTPIKMEVGIEDCLHIEFEYSKSKYHLKDVVIGKVYFLLVRIKIKQMELGLSRKESTGSGASLTHESQTLTKFELMDGSPVRGESIPVRLFLGGFELTPTYRAIQNKFSVKYYLNLVLIDEEDRRYFKQQEIVLWRKSPKKKGKSQAQEVQEEEPSAE